MPSEFDDFSDRAHRNYQGGSPEARRNCQILQDAMQRQGFVPLKTEWWHFDLKGWSDFPVVDIPVESIPTSEVPTAQATG